MKTKYFIRKANDLGYIVQMKSPSHLLISTRMNTREVALIDLHNGDFWINSDNILIIEHCLKYAKSVKKGEHK